MVGVGGGFICTAALAIVTLLTKSHQIVLDQKASGNALLETRKGILETPCPGLGPQIPKLWTLSIKPQSLTLNPKPLIMNPIPQTLNPTPQIPNPEPQTSSTKYQTPNTEHRTPKGDGGTAATTPGGPGAPMAGTLSLSLSHTHTFSLYLAISNTHTHILSVSLKVDGFVPHTPNVNLSTARSSARRIRSAYGRCRVWLRVEV